MSEKLDQSFKEGFYKSASSTESYRKEVNKKTSHGIRGGGAYAGKYKKSFMPTAERYTKGQSKQKEWGVNKHRALASGIYGTGGAGLGAIVGGMKGKGGKGALIGGAAGVLAGIARGKSLNEKQKKRIQNAKEIMKIKDKKKRELAMAKNYSKAY
jgi:hypothetical protein